MTALIVLFVLIAIPLIRILLGLFVRDEDGEEDGDGYETWSDGSDIRYESIDGNVSPSPFQKRESEEVHEYDEVPPAPAPSAVSPFYAPSFIRIQQLSGPNAPNTRDKVRVLDVDGTYEVNMESPISGTHLLLEYSAGVCYLLGQEKVPLIPDRPLILYSRNSRGTRIPQYALTFVTYEEADHA